VAGTRQGMARAPSERDTQQADGRHFHAARLVDSMAAWSSFGFVGVGSFWHCFVMRMCSLCPCTFTVMRERRGKANCWAACMGWNVVGNIHAEL
jgi:hypothetical protein